MDVRRRRGISGGNPEVLDGIRVLFLDQEKLAHLIGLRGTLGHFGSERIELSGILRATRDFLGYPVRLAGNSRFKRPGLRQQSLRNLTGGRGRSEKVAGGK